MQRRNNQWFQTLKRVSPWLLAVYWVILFVLTHVPVPAGPPNSDKVLHVAAYTVLATLFATVLLTREVPKARLVRLTVVTLCTFAVFDELTQELVNRFCDPMDMLADAIGVLCGLGFVLTMSAKLFGPSGTSES